MDSAFLCDLMQLIIPIKCPFYFFSLVYGGHLNYIKSHETKSDLLLQTSTNAPNMLCTKLNASIFKEQIPENNTVRKFWLQKSQAYSTPYMIKKQLSYLLLKALLIRLLISPLSKWDNKTERLSKNLSADFRIQGLCKRVIGNH